MDLTQIVGGGPTFFYLVPWIVFFPVIGLLVNILFGSRFSEKVIGTVASLASGLAFVVSLLLMFSLFAQPEGAIVPLLDWITIGSLNLQWSFQVDTLSVTMMLVVSGIGTLIHIYSIGYMHEDVRHHEDPKRFRRFFVYLNLFIAMMMILVSADNYLMLFVGWEGVGLCSYLLIGFWFEFGEGGLGNAIAAKKAMIANRVGDFGFLLAAFSVFWAFGSLNFNQVFEQVPAVAAATPAVILAITLFFLIGVTGKSAQIPLYVWLPDAMAGPTPVSALIHAATMVTAGVYLVTRSYPLYSSLAQAQSVVTIVGGVTALFAATIAVAQFDIKKVLAYSTISQLGFMVAAVGMGAFAAGMFHLVTHAFFKALLFLSSGSVIQGMEAGEHHVAHDAVLKKRFRPAEHFDPQDMRNMGGLRTRMPITFWVYTIGSLALAGIFPFAGFWSKDEILAEASHLQPTVYWLLTIAAFFTAFYMGRQIFLVFFGKPRSLPAEHAPENPPVMTVPLIILAALSTLGGALNLPGMHSFASWLENTIHVGEETAQAAVSGFAPGVVVMVGEFNLTIAIIATVLAVAAIALAYFLYYRRYQEQQSLPAAKRPIDPLQSYIGPLFNVFANKYWVDEIYDALIVNPYKGLSAFFADVIDGRFWHDWFHDTVIAGGFRAFTNGLAYQFDLGVIDSIGNGLGYIARGMAMAGRRLQSGLVRSYVFAVFVGVVIIIGYLIWR